MNVILYGGGRSGGKTSLEKIRRSRMSDILQKAKALQLEAAHEKPITIRLSFLQAMIAEIERLQSTQGENNGEEAKVHGRARIRSVGNDEG